MAAYFTSKGFYATVIVIVTAAILIRIAASVSKRYKNKANRDKHSFYIDRFYHIFKWLVLVITAFAILQVNDINIGSLLTGVGIISVVVGFALQDIFKDLIVGFHIINDEALKIGDCVKIAGHEGVVKGFSFMTTKLHDIDDGTTVFIHNRNITEVVQSYGFYDFDLRISMDEDYRRIGEIFTECAEELSKLKSVKSSEYRGVHDYMDGSVVYRIRILFKPAEKYKSRADSMNVINRYVQDNKIMMYTSVVELKDKVGSGKGGGHKTV